MAMVHAYGDTQRWPRDIRVQRTHLELGARSCGCRLRPELRRAGVRRAGRVGACEWRPGAAAEAEVERGWAAAGRGLSGAGGEWPVPTVQPAS